VLGIVLGVAAAGGIVSFLRKPFVRRRFLARRKQ